MRALSIDEEIAMYQFAQGVQSETELLNLFSRLEEPEKRRRFLDLNTYVRRLKPTEVDREQALVASSLNEADLADVFPQADRSKIILHNTINLPEGGFEKVYTFLLYVFRVAYQQHAKLGNPADWHYWDLANPEVVETIRTQHRAMVEEVYTNLGFRSEFASIARLCHEQEVAFRTKNQAPAPAHDNQFHFLNYDEMITESLRLVDNKQARSAWILHHSLEKALMIQYKVEPDEIKRVMREVIQRHSRDTFQTDLFW